MCDVKLAKAVLFMFNVIFWLAGALLLGIGIWIKIDPTIVNYLNVVDISGSDPLISHAAVIFIVVGAAVFVVGFLGCCGAVREHQGLLFVYAFLLLVIMAAEITAAILILVYRNKVQELLQQEMTKELNKQYMNNNSMGSAWDHLQTLLSCCGVQNYTDYVGSAWYNASMAGVNKTYVPVSCCMSTSVTQQCQRDAKAMVTTSNTLFTKGCYKEIEAWLDKHSLIMMLIAFILGGLEIIGFVTACCMRSALKKKPLKE